MLNDHTQRELRECYEQAAFCVRQAEAQNDPRVKQQFLELTRRWLLLAKGLAEPPFTPSPNTQPSGYEGG
jgi:hypothetical protein